MLVSYSATFIVMLLNLCSVFCYSVGEELNKEDVDSETCNKFCNVQIEKTGGCCHNSESCQECGELTVGQYTCVYIYMLDCIQNIMIVLCLIMVWKQLHKSEKEMLN